MATKTSKSKKSAVPKQQIVKRRTIELTDDIRHDEPAAWMVFLHDPTMHEYLVFPDKRAAESCATRQAEESDTDWLMYPLYATHGQSV